MSLLPKRDKPGRFELRFVGDDEPIAVFDSLEEWRQGAQLLLATMFEMQEEYETEKADEPS